MSRSILLIALFGASPAWAGSVTLGSLTGFDEARAPCNTSSAPWSYDSATGSIETSVTIDASNGVHDLVQSALEGALGTGDYPVLLTTFESHEHRYTNRTGFSTGKDAFEDSCSGSTGCHSTSQPSSGDWVKISVTNSSNQTSTRWYGDFANSSTSTASAAVFPIAWDHFTVTLDQNLGLGPLVQGLATDPCDIVEIEITVHVEYDMEAECEGYVATWAGQGNYHANIEWGDAVDNELSWDSSITCP